MSQKQQNPWIEGLQTIGLSIALALGIRQFVAEARYIPSESMKPTLLINDRLVVEKISYRFQTPQRGDIIVFWPPSEIVSEGQKRDAFIKRIVGLPGDTIEVTNGTVLVNGDALDESYIKSPPTYEQELLTIPDDSYFVLGDNRNQSYDSHAWDISQPFVPGDQIIGKAVVRFWPLTRLGGLE
ncbi:MAG: signal peptidase I [Leptolyngbyaceae cyanobacterium MAG.088]|nr:signal peptidase I [Leptolyngbyaceae cyanobacterium MAG.088]